MRSRYTKDGKYITQHKLKYREGTDADSFHFKMCFEGFANAVRSYCGNELAVVSLWVDTKHQGRMMWTTIQEVEGDEADMLTAPRYRRLTGTIVTKRIRKKINLQEHLNIASENFLDAFHEQIEAVQRAEARAKHS